MKNSHWAQKNERGTPFFLRLTARLVLFLPRWALRMVAHTVVLYFFLTSARERQFIRAYQKHLQAAFPDVRLPEHFPVLRQFAAFADTVCDAFGVWQGKIRFADTVYSDPDGLSAASESGGRGQIFVSAHFGNVEICRTFAARHPGFVMNILVYSRHAPAFEKAMKAAGAGAENIRMVPVDDLDAAQMLQLQQKLERGEWLAVAADRVPVRGSKTVEVDFLGARAKFPQGAWLLAGLLGAPVNVLFCPRENGRYHIKIRKFCDAVSWTRETRGAVIRECAQNYADLLAQQCAQNPLQWFNFYDFWEEHGA